MTFVDAVGKADALRASFRQTPGGASRSTVRALFGLPSMATASQLTAAMKHQSARHTALLEAFSPEALRRDRERSEVIRRAFAQTDARPAWR